MSKTLPEPPKNVLPATSSLSIFDAARTDGTAIGLVAEGRDHTFAELADRTARVLTWLDRRLAGSTRVALVATASVETLVLVYALAARGVTAAFLHPRLTPAERARGAEAFAAGSALLLIEDPAAELADARALAPSAAPGRVDAEAPLGVLFTSGTTGTPKGVVLSRRAFMASAAASEANLGWQRDDRWLLCMPVAHVGGLSIVVRCLLARRPVVLEPRFDPAPIAEAITRERVTIASFVPTMLARLFDALPVPGARDVASPPLRAVMLGGAATPPKMLAAAAERGLPVLTTYGMTESCSQVTTQRPGTRPCVEEGSGAPLVGAGVRIVDERIEVRGPMLFSGYWGEPPFARDAWFCTTDFGSLDDCGRLHVRGRVSERIVTGGENVDPAEVEEELERVDGIRAACVFGLPDEVWGEIVCVALVPASTRRDIGLAAVFRERLASHKRPRRAIWVEALVVAPSGKLDRCATREMAAPMLVDISR